LKLVSKRLKPIDHDRWVELEFKDALTEAEQRGKAALERGNLKSD
jgi:hypothetical protein